MGVYKRTNLLEPRQPKKDLNRRPSPADRRSNIGGPNSDVRMEHTYECADADV